MPTTKFNKPVLKILAISIASTIVSACGGESSPRTGGSIATEQGQFVDSPVEGLRYDSGSGVTGVTDSDGKFRYVRGQEISFYISNTLLGTAEGAQIMTPANLAKAENQNNRITSPALINRLRLLQALDTDSNPENGITLPGDAALPGVTTLNFALDTVTFLSQPVVEGLLNIIGLNGNDLPDDTQALAHFEQYTLSNLFQGCYVGSVQDFGDMVLKVYPNGSINGLAPLQENASPVPVTGTIRGDGDFSFGPSATPSMFTGEMSPLDGQTIAVFASESLDKQGGLISKNPLRFPTFDVSRCNNL